ncbi:MAG TPA: tetratricopeptide repeat protein [Candidatus Angelobacter sp.]|nr:tetratricopeptide repeat protein [Candidatus Angelobacter sp.]
MKSKSTSRFEKKHRRLSSFFGAILLAILSISPLASATEAPTAQRGAGNQKVIRDPVEYNAYITALNTQDPAQKGAAMEAFVRNYPESVVKVDALEQAMAAYQQAGNQAKVNEIAKRILAMEPNNLRALAVIVYIERLSTDGLRPEACASALRGLQILGSWQKPEVLGEVEFHKLRAQMAEIFFGAAGQCALLAKDYAAARDYYFKALQINPRDLQNVYQLAVADLEMTPIDVNGFWYVAKSMNLAQEQGNEQAKKGMEAYGKAKYKNYHGGDDGWDDLIKEASTETAPPTIDGVKIKKAPTPPELAVKAVQENDPQSLSFSDWEFVLQYQDASPANKNAADKVWQAIQSRQKNGQAKLKVPVKVISATKDMIHGAITDENQSANKADLQVVMAKPLSRPPGPGAMVDVMGVMTGYTPQPFMFTMGNGELPGAKPATHTLSEADVEELLRGGVTPKRATALVRQQGVSFTLDDTIETRLRKAGATDELLLAITKAKQ